jgi:hypothetical protein
MITNMDAVDYHLLNSLSASQINLLNKSPAHYKASIDGLLKYDSKALDLGKKVHLRLESKVLFDQKYVLKTSDHDGRTKNGKLAIADIKSSGMELITYDELDQIESMIRGYESCNDDLIRIARESTGMNEITVLWEERDRDMRCRPDRLIYPSDDDGEWLCEQFPMLFSSSFGITICVDFKTTKRFPDPKTWFWHSRDYGYPLAASHYLAGTHADAFLWIVLEVNPPYTVTRYLLSPQTKEQMDERRQQLIDLLDRCEQEDRWPSLTVNRDETLV